MYNTPLLLEFLHHLDFFWTGLSMPLVPELSFCEPFNNTVEQCKQTIYKINVDVQIKWNKTLTLSYVVFRMM